jgi:hypothetical protein
MYEAEIRTILANDECVRRMAEAGHRHLWDDSEALDMQLTLEELQRAMNKVEGTRGLVETE